jgi:hypothetical protein
MSCLDRRNAVAFISCLGLVCFGLRQELALNYGVPLNSGNHIRGCSKVAGLLSMHCFKILLFFYSVHPVGRSPWLTCVGVSRACLVWVCLVWLAFVCVWPRLFAFRHPCC